MSTSSKKQANTQKSTNNAMTSFGLIEENIELSHIHLAVLKELRETMSRANQKFVK